MEVRMDISCISLDLRTLTSDFVTRLLPSFVYYLKYLQVFIDIRSETGWRSRVLRFMAERERPI